MAVPLKIDRVSWIDIYRDGGSLGVDFDGTVGDSYNLLLKVELGQLPDREFEVIGYTPKLTAYYPYEWKSEITGYVHSESTTKRISVDWVDVDNMLAQMKDKIDKIDVDLCECPLTEEDKKRLADLFQEMVEISKNLGKVDIPR